MHQSAMEGLDAALNNLTNAWQKLISNIANGDSFKWLVNTLSGIVKWFADGNTLLKIFTIAITAFNAKTLLTNMRLQQTGDKVRNVDTAFATLGTRLKGLGTQFSSLTKQMSAESTAIQNQTTLIREQIQAYQDLAAAKAGTYTGPNIATPNGGGVPVAGGPKATIPDADTIEKTSGATKNLNKNLSTGAGKIKTFGSNVVSLIGYVQTGIMVGMWAASIAETVTD